MGSWERKGLRIRDLQTLLEMTGDKRVKYAP